MFGPHLGCKHSICFANWHDGFGLRERHLGFDYEYTKNINKYMNSYCRWLVELGRLSQEEVDCYNSLVLNGVFNLDCLLPDSTIDTHLNPKYLREMLEDSNSTHNQLELIVWFPTRKITMLDDDCDEIYV